MSSQIGQSATAAAYVKLSILTLSFEQALIFFWVPTVGYVFARLSCFMLFFQSYRDVSTLELVRQPQAKTCLIQQKNYTTAINFRKNIYKVQHRCVFKVISNWRDIESALLNFLRRSRVNIPKRAERKSQLECKGKKC